MTAFSVPWLHPPSLLQEFPHRGCQPSISRHLWTLPSGHPCQGHCKLHVWGRELMPPPEKLPSLCVFSLSPAVDPVPQTQNLGALSCSFVPGVLLRVLAPLFPQHPQVTWLRPPPLPRTLQPLNFLPAQTPSLSLATVHGRPDPTIHPNSGLQAQGRSDLLTWGLRPFTPGANPPSHPYPQLPHHRSTLWPRRDFCGSPIYLLMLL